MSLCLLYLSYGHSKKYFKYKFYYLVILFQKLKT